MRPYSINLIHPTMILIANKADLVAERPSIDKKEFSKTVFTSAAHLEGISQLEEAILQIVLAGQAQAANMELAINQRQKFALTQALNHLEEASTAIENQMPLDFWTIDLRGAIQRLGEITGEEMVESVLDRIFSRFCIGK